MPEPLVSEDSNLERLMQTVHSQPGARILYQDTVRRGGLLGFFAREVHRVAYQLPEPAAATTAPAPATTTPAEFAPADVQQEPAAVELVARPCPPAPNSFEAILRSFDSTSEQLGLTGPAPEWDDRSRGLADLLAETDAVELHQAGAGDSADFAELLRRLTMADEVATDEPAPAVTPRPSLEPRRPINPAATSQPAPAGRPEARDRLELLMQLRQVGVPVSVNPSSETHTVYQALEDILRELPAPVEPPRQAGAVLAIVGESTQALRAARTVATMLRIPDDTIGVAGLPPETSTGLCQLTGPVEAQRMRERLLAADTPSIVVIATDGATTGPADPWVNQLLAALAPSATWAVIDARWKTDDSRGYLDRLGAVDALVVHSAELSGSPASVWDLDLPLALLDGRSPTTFAWTGLLSQVLASGARHRASV